MSTIRDQIRSFILTTFLDGGDPASLQNDTSLERAHIVDSAGMLEIILFIEENFGFSVDNDDATPENFDTIDAMTAYIERKRSELGL
jgi:acyl carrier protein